MTDPPATAARVRCNNRECDNYGREVVLRQDTCPYCGMPTRERLTKPLARFDVAHAIQHYKHPGGPPLASMEAFALADSILAHLIDGGWEHPDA